MKNPIVLKDELRILNADRSAVLTELRNRGQQLKDTQMEIEEAEQRLAEVETETREKRARLDEIVSRASFVSDEIAKKKQELSSTSLRLETESVKNSHQRKLHLGRIKELEEKEHELLRNADELKKVYDSNSTLFISTISELKKKLRDMTIELDEKVTEHKKVTKEVDALKEEDKKITKERLKREDKVRSRERAVELRELGLSKREEDLATMSNDLLIIYHRLKEAYATYDPDLDIDRLIFKAV